MIFSETKSPFNSNVLFPEVEQEELVDTESIKDFEDGNKVILFNDDVHTFDEVALQLVKAIQCDIETAYELANEVHCNGKAAVFYGELFKCVRVSQILEEIELHTQIEC